MRPTTGSRQPRRHASDVGIPGSSPRHRFLRSFFPPRCLRADPRGPFGDLASLDLCPRRAACFKHAAALLAAGEEPLNARAASLTIRAVRAVGVEVPMTYALGTSAAKITTASLVLLDLETNEGVT